MKKYASELSDFSALLQATAQSKKIPAAIIEKDYYLTRALQAMAEGHSGQFVLKGGTSLSKGWQLLQRFSEDIELLLRATPSSGAQARHARLEECAKTIERTEGLKLEKVPSSETGIHRTVIFTYAGVTSDLPGLGRTVILEAGYRGNAAGAVTRKVESMVAEFAIANRYEDLAADLGPLQIEMQNLLMTFVEKLFAVHAAYTKDSAAAGKARHYYDLHEMCRLPEIQTFVGTQDYRTCVAEVRRFSEKVFKGQPLPESDSFSMSPAFQPDEDGLEKLERNYKLEADLFFAEQPPLAQVLKTIGDLLPKL